MPQVKRTYSVNHVISVRPGAWDDKGCGCFSVVEINDRLHLYYMASGIRNSWRIGLATSDDGIRWQRSPANPVLSVGPTERWDHRSVSMPSVLNDAGRLWMIYSGAVRGAAVVSDGRTQLTA